MVEPNFNITEITSNSDFGEFVIEPLEPGYGHTVGNALRRVLLTSIPGAAVTSVKISGVKHKFSTLAGLKENIVDLLLNIKGINFQLADSKQTATVTISEKGPKEITAGDIIVSDGVEVINKDHYIASLADKKAKLEIELTIEKGQGYSLSEERKASSREVFP